MMAPLRELANLPAELYEIFNLGERLGDFRGRLEQGVDAYRDKYGKLAKRARVAHGVMVGVTGYGAGQLLFFDPPTFYGAVGKAVILPIFTFYALDGLASAVTGIDYPIQKYFSEKLKK